MILRGRGRAISRLEAFSDAVFAFSATLLVVSLEVPRTYPELVAGLEGFVAFGLAFATVFLCFGLLFLRAHAKAGELELDAAERHEARFLFRHYLLFSAVGVLSVLAAWAGLGLEVALPGWLYGLMGPVGYLHGRWSYRNAPAAGPVPAPAAGPAAEL